MEDAGRELFTPEVEVRDGQLETGYTPPDLNEHITTPFSEIRNIYKEGKDSSHQSFRILVHELSTGYLTMLCDSFAAFLDSDLQSKFSDKVPIVALQLLGMTEGPLVIPRRYQYWRKFLSELLVWIRSKVCQRLANL